MYKTTYNKQNYPFYRLKLLVKKFGFVSSYNPIKIKVFMNIRKSEMFTKGLNLHHNGPSLTETIEYFRY